MKTILFAAMGILSGSAITIQSSLSGQLSKRLSSPLLASSSLFLVGFLAISLLLALSHGRLPSSEAIRETPKHLWLGGGIISACSLSCVYWIMPQIGVSATMLYVLAGQIVTSAAVSHYAWFGLPVASLSPQRCIALALVLIGAMVFNAKPAAL